MRKQHLPIQRLMSHESLVAMADELRYADVSSLYAAVGEGHVSAASVVARLVQSLGGEEGASEDARRGDACRPGRRGARPHRRPGRRRQGRRRHVGQAGQVLHARCPATRSSGSSPAAAASPCTAATASTSRACWPSPSAWSRWSGPVGRHGVPRADPGRGARPQPAAVGRHPGAVGRARQHPVGARADHPRPGGASRGSCSRWATRRTWVTCWPRSAGSTASSTSTGSTGGKIVSPTS